MTPTCDICGAKGATPCATGTAYCAQHEPGHLLLPNEWAMLSPAQQQRREHANETLANVPPQPTAQQAQES